MSMGGELTNGWSLFADNGGDGSAVARSDQRASSNWRALKSALLLGAASCIAYPASAQQAPEAVPLPQLNVEASAKKKAAAKKSSPKKAPVAAQVQPAPEPQPPEPVAGTSRRSRHSGRQSLRQPERALQGRAVGVRQTDRATAGYAENGDGDAEGGDGGSGGARPARARPQCPRVDHRIGRGRQRLRRVRHSRLQGQQRHLRRQHPQSRQHWSRTCSPSSRSRSTRGRAAVSPGAAPSAAPST